MRIPKGTSSWVLLCIVLLSLSASSSRADDCNRNGIEDLRDIANRTSPDCNRNEVPDECDIAPMQIGFSGPNEFLVAGPGGSLGSFAIEDFDGDGDRDLALSAAPSRLDLHLNAGDGSFDRPRTVYAGGFWTFLAADFNDDGHMDLAVAAQIQLRPFAVLLNEGGGTFGPPSLPPIEGHATTLRAADFDGDGDTDLVTFDDLELRDHTFLLFRNNGGATFTARTMSLPQKPRLQLPGDFNGDGRADLIANIIRTEGMLLLLGQTNGDFLAEERTWTLPPDPWFLLSGDLDFDRDLDLLLGPWAILNRGDGTFDAPFRTSVSASGWPSPSLADVDGDGILDVLGGETEGRYRLTVNLGRGDAIFRPPIEIPMRLPPHKVFATRLDGDQHPDLLAVSGLGASGVKVSVLLGKGSGVPAIPDSNLNGVPDDCEPDCDRNGLPDDLDLARGALPDCNHNGVPDPCELAPRLRFGQASCAFQEQFPPETGLWPIVAHLNDDRYPDLAFLVNSGVFTQTAPGQFETLRKLVVFLVLGDGSLHHVLEREFQLQIGPLAAADVDRDGDQDLITAIASTRQVLVLRNAGDGFFEDPEIFQGGSQLASRVIVADFDLDGAPDLVLEGTSLLLNEGDGTFGKAQDLPWGSDLIAGDFNGDRAPDLAWSRTPGNIPVYVYVCLNDGQGKFFFPQRIQSGQALAAADYDGDGDLDILVKNDIEHVLLLNRGDASFDTVRAFPEASGYFIRLSTDLDGDGDIDLVETGGPRVQVLPNDGKGRFGNPLSLFERMVGNDYGDQYVAADFDQNGKTDLAFGGSEECLLRVALNESLPGTSRDDDRNGIPDDCDPPRGAQRPGDASQDGKLDLTDIVWLVGHLFLGDGTVLPCEGGTARNPGPGELALLDSSGDGRLDVSDPIAVIFHLFLGDGPPTLGSRCRLLSGCPTRCSP